MDTPEINQTMTDADVVRLQYRAEVQLDEAEATGDQDAIRRWDAVWYACEAELDRRAAQREQTELAPISSK